MSISEGPEAPADDSSILFLLCLVRIALSLAASREVMLTLLWSRFKQRHQSISDLYVIFEGSPVNYRQVDILISKNQVLQIIYLKHHVYETS